MVWSSKCNIFLSKWLSLAKLPLRKMSVTVIMTGKILVYSNLKLSCDHSWLVEAWEWHLCCSIVCSSCLLLYWSWSNLPNLDCHHNCEVCQGKRRYWNNVETFASGPFCYCAVCVDIFLRRRVLGAKHLLGSWVQFSFDASNFANGSSV